ncbi:Uncharacterised protein [Salmonella enterica subsp. enterica]|uniref:Uncharacterized protein n=1 Tax=Salmonella enterica I TaxID=59201 RepID=A0A379V347_SALET|nr:Uncharacterised protein [Salmonella enterica subsp. enterica]
MRYYLFLLLIICQNTFTEEIKPLPQGDTWRKYIALSLRDEEGLRMGCLTCGGLKQTVALLTFVA